MSRMMLGMPAWTEYLAVPDNGECKQNLSVPR
jgi:hypothetical protein